MRALVIINPSSGQKIIQKNAEIIVKKLLSDSTLSHADIIKTQKQNDAYNAALNLKDDDCDLVIAVGGDGTINEVINGLMDGQHSAALAILPAGTTNNYANYMAIPHEVDKFCRMIRQNHTISIDIGKAGNQYFINDASAGLFTEIPYSVSSEAKTVMGQMAYYVEAIKKLTSSAVPNTFPVSLHVDGHTIEDDILLFLISNSPSSGGFDKALPKANVYDGLLDLLIIHKQKLKDLVPLFFQLSNGNHIGNPNITYIQTKQIIIGSMSDESVYLDLDGEKGPALPTTVQVIPHAVKLVVPEGKGGGDW
jgi:diacylglycerol kinase (ATP)